MARSDAVVVATRQSQVDRGRKRGREITRALVTELVVARQTAGISQAAIARQLGTSQSDVSRLERLAAVDDISVVHLAELAALLGLDLSAGLHPNGERLADRGHQALIARFVGLISPDWKVAREVPLPSIGDRRSWDLLLRLGSQIVGVEAETRIRDMQRLVRRIRERERDGGAEQVLLLLSDSRVNRRLRPDLLDALGSRYQTPARDLWRALREGQPLPGSGVVLV